MNQNEDFLNEVIPGLLKEKKAVPPKYLYDERGSQIFEEICLLEDYYPTRTEARILQENGNEIGAYLGEDIILIEPGSGAGDKVRFLLPHIRGPRAYVPIEISGEILLRMAGELENEFPGLMVLPVWGDFTADFVLPQMVKNSTQKKVVFFPGSTIGNLDPQEAVDFLKKYTELLGPNVAFLIGLDLKKDQERLERAYDDSHGVTAAFNMNLLLRLNREAGASFDLSNFSHKAFYNEEKGRIEMHLVSRVTHDVQIHQELLHFEAGESIHTENSYKYCIYEFAELCAEAGLRVKKTWQDEELLFCVYYLETEVPHAND